MKFDNASLESSHINKKRDYANAIRILSADSVEKAQSGHPGLPLGFADIFSCLVTKFLKYAPENPRWQFRDRLVLSAGHGSMLLYSFYYLAGYEGYDIEQIKNFRKLGSITPGHPEYDGSSPVETTTGPLGQGFASSVGMAIAQKKYEQKLGSIANYKIYVIAGDGCLMEGITHEAASLAGHLGLNNLVVLFDDNQISIDGPTSLTTSENHIQKFTSQGWNCFACDGHNYEEIEKTLKATQNSDKPCFIAFRTKIGFGAGKKEGSEKSHGAALGKDAISALRAKLNWSDEEFYVPKEILENCRKSWEYNKGLYEESLKEINNLSSADLDYLSKPNKKNLISNISLNATNILEPEATRSSFGRLVESLNKISEKIIVGSADLSHSNSLYNSFSKPILANDFSGNFIHFGVRENAMAAIMNGLAIENFLPICGTFLVFSDYMKPSIRLSAIMNLDVIYVFTHDSIGVGEDGPTHQPVEHLPSLRAIPNFTTFRPCDYLECKESLSYYLSSLNGPSAFILTRQKLPQHDILDSRHVSKGAYYISRGTQNSINIWATGSEISIAIETKKILATHKIDANVISVPSIDLFFMADKNYQTELNPKNQINFVIEAATSLGWDRIIKSDGLFFGVDTFGLSSNYEEIYDHFGLTAPKIATKILEYLNDKNRN